MAGVHYPATFAVPLTVRARRVPEGLWRWRAWIVGIALCVGIGAWRFGWILAQGGPSGPDPGDWLALGHDLFGERVRAAYTVVPPLVPALSKGASAVLSPLPGLALVGALASVAAGPAVFFLGYQAGGIVWGGLVTLAVLFLPYSVGEALGWGGYPQMLGQGLMLGCMATLGTALARGGSKTLLFLSALLGVLGLFTSVWTVASLGVAAPLLFTFAIWYRWVHPKVLRSIFQWWGVPFLLGGMLLAPIYGIYFSSFAEVPLNPGGLAFGESVAFVFREWPGHAGSVFLVIPLATGLVTYCLLPWGRITVLHAITVPIIATAFALYIPTGESRFLGLLEVGIVVGLCAVLNDLWASLQDLQPLHRVLGQGVVLAVTLTFVLFLVVRGHQRTVAAHEWYKVVTPEVHQALEWLRVNGVPRSVVVASDNPRGFQYFWWVEGYARLPAFSASDPKWMALKDEVWQNAVALRLVHSTSTDDIVSLVREHRIRYLFLDKRVIKETSHLVTAGFTPALENDTIIVLEWRGE
ncbi:MAG: hypothetical protein NZ951_03845 [Dehalococcoidia bacterium]|nr:hypothetical protein [Dehalococcoidia bacterium]